MTYALGQYTQNIAMIIIFTTFVNLIMPNGDFQKYIKMVLGLIVIITILAPINTILFKNKPNYTDILKRYQLDIEQATVQVESGMFLDAQKDIILENYREKLTPQIIEIVEKSGKVTVMALGVDLNEDTMSNEFGKITAIDMMVGSTNQENDKNTIKIPKVKVGTKKIEQDSAVGNEGQIEKDIKTCLIDFYNLSNVNINITVQKNS